MKTSIYITLIALLYGVTSCAQTKFAEGKMTINNSIFEVSKSPNVINNQKTVFIFPQQNKYKGPLPSSQDNYQFRVLKNDIHVDLELVKSIVNNVLKNKLPDLHQKEEKLGMSFIFETSGLLTDINYTLLENSLIKPNDIENIDKMLRINVKASFTGIDYKHYAAVSYLMPSMRF